MYRYGNWGRKHITMVTGTEMYHYGNWDGRLRQCKWSVEYVYYCGNSSRQCSAALYVMMLALITLVFSSLRSKADKHLATEGLVQAHCITSRLPTRCGNTA